MKTILIMLFTAASICACAQDTTVTQIEYFFDSDNGVGNDSLVNVTPAADGTFPFTASIAGLSVGYHKLYIRTKDSQGKWSQTARRNVEIFTPDDNAKVTLVSGEYFIDTDTGFGSNHPIVITTPDSVVLQDFNAATAGLAVGYHKLYGRLKDNLGRWSQTFRRNIEVYRNDTNYVYNAEYFFKTDNGYGDCTEIKLTNPSVDGTFLLNIPLGQVPAGADTTLFIRVQDSAEGKWSLTVLKDNSVILPLTLLNFTVVKQNSIAQLNWQTTNEVNTSYFDVQRSNDGIHFTSIGKATAKGNSSANNSYSFGDNIAAAAAGNLYYRLQMTDKDGSFSYSRVAYISIDAAKMKIVLLPNPAHNYFVISNDENIETGKAAIIVRDIQGRALITQHFISASRQRIDVSALAKGMYLVSIASPGKTQTIRLLIE